jgi:Zn-dependent M28 family amino/carboxypeptidase
VDRLRALGLDDVHAESFHFPRHDVSAATLAVTVAGAARPVGFDVLEGSGSARVEGDVVAVGGATATELDAVDVRGRIALVERRQTYHRSTQYRNVAARGALAMLYVSDAVDNLRQVGSVRRTFEAMGDIPALSIGGLDGAALAHDAHATLEVRASSTPATGQNVLGRIAGALPSQIVVGAHYDSWFAGSSDNGGGVAALLALAARRSRPGAPKPRHTLVFVAYDGEEIALYGGYDFLRRHRAEVVAAVNFEVPSAVGASFAGLGRSNLATVESAVDDAGLRGDYLLTVPMDAVPQLFGGIIPTDIQGLYRSGVPTISTAVAAPYYHTVADTPDKVDTALLADAVDRFDLALAELDAADDALLAVPDPALWRASASVVENDGQVTVSVAVTDAAGAPRAHAPVAALILTDDFFLGEEVSGTTDDVGNATLGLPAHAGQPRRSVHVTAGPVYPLVETVVSLP